MFKSCTRQLYRGAKPGAWLPPRLRPPAGGDRINPQLESTISIPSLLVNSDRKIRFVVVGCGRIAGRHFEALQARADEAELVGVCDTAADARDIEVEDTAVVSIKWRSGALGSMSVTMSTYPRNLEGSITTIGETATVRVGGVAVNEIQQWEFADWDPDDDLVTHGSYETSSVYGHGHPLYYQNVDVLRGRATADTDDREGLKSLELLTGICLSARDGRRVSLPLDH